MINKIKKIINNKFHRFFKFAFFLRYLFLIFFISATLFLLIPNFFDYKKKEDILITYLMENYNLDIRSIKKIKFKSFPLPTLELDELEINFPKSQTTLIAKKIIIYPKLASIYNYENFRVDKLILKQSKITIETKSIDILKKFILDSKKKINFKDLNVRINNKKNYIINLKNINYKNYGYKKNIFEGRVFDRKFKVNIQDDFKNIDFRLIKTGIVVNLNILESVQNAYSKGILKGKFLQSSLKLDFIYDRNSLKIESLYFRDKQLSFDSNGLINLNPFFEINLNSEIKSINIEEIKKLNFSSISYFKEILKKANINNSFSYKSKKFSRNLIDNFNAKTSLAYGRLNFSKNLLISDSNFICKGRINFLDEYPVLYFNCTLDSKNKQKLLRKLNIDQKINNKSSLKLNVKGNLNILNNKVNFDKIEMNNEYNASKEDLIYFKTSFERILFNENFIEIFHLFKIRNFFQEIL